MKKISQIIAYSVLGVLVLGLILCSILKISFKPELCVPTTEEVGKVKISTTDGTTRVESNSDNIGISTFENKFNSAFEITVLSSLFSGRIGSKVERNKLTSLPKSTGYEVLYIYNEEQVLKVDGKEVPVADNSTTPIKYNRVVYSVNGNTGLSKVSLYFYTEGIASYYQITTYANFNDLYDYISNITMFKD